MRMRKKNLSERVRENKFAFGKEKRRENMLPSRINDGFVITTVTISAVFVNQTHAQTPLKIKRDEPVETV